MCTSVPQNDAMSTRIRTSVGVGSGIATFRTSVLPGAGLSFTAAFIVDVMTRIPGPRACAWACGISTLYHLIGRSRRTCCHGSSLNRVELRGAASDDHEPVLPVVGLVVHCGTVGI